MYHKLMNKP